MKKIENLKITRITMHEQVFNKLKEEINNGRWKVNEKIPTEMELAKIFGVNRLTIRMAIQRLIGIGVLETKVGNGTYIKKFDFKEYLKKASDFYLTSDMNDKVCEFREVIELNCIRLIIKNASLDEIKQLENICNSMDEYKNKFINTHNEKYYNNFLNKDIEFHETICKLSHNELFVYSFEIIRELIYKYMDNLLRERTKSWIDKFNKGTFEEDLHRKIFVALLEKNEEKCIKEYKKMINYQSKF